MMTRAPFVCVLVLLAVVQHRQPRESTTCEANIVSATVVATYCSHAAGDHDVVDLLILWRGRAGWFQRRPGGRYVSGGSHTEGGGVAGHVIEHRQYGDVEIRYDADFERGTVTIDGMAPIAIDRMTALATFDRRAVEVDDACPARPCGKGVPHQGARCGIRDLIRSG